MKSWNFPGIPPLRDEVIQFLFDLCSVNSGYDEQGYKIANRNVLIDLVFGSSEESKEREVIAERANQKLQKNSGGVIKQLNKDRETVAKGPIVIPKAVEINKSKSYAKTRVAWDDTAGDNIMLGGKLSIIQILCKVIHVFMLLSLHKYHVLRFFPLHFP